MFTSKNFDFKQIITKATKISQKINFNSNNVRNMKKLAFGPFIMGLIIAIIMGIGLYYEIIFGKLKWETGIIIFLLFYILGTIFSMILVSKYINIFSYFVLKRISKKEYEIYEYKTSVQALYIASKLVPHRFDWTGLWGPRENGNVMILDNQKVYLSDENFKSLQNDKEIILYIARYQNSYVLFDFERVLNNDSMENYIKEKNNVSIISIVTIIIFIIMILLLPVLFK